MFKQPNQALELHHPLSTICLLLISRLFLLLSHCSNLEVCLPLAHFKVSQLLHQALESCHPLIIARLLLITLLLHYLCSNLRIVLALLHLRCFRILFRLGCLHLPLPLHPLIMFPFLQIVLCSLLNQERAPYLLLLCREYPSHQHLLSKVRHLRSRFQSRSILQETPLHPHPHFKIFPVLLRTNSLCPQLPPLPRALLQTLTVSNQPSNPSLETQSHLPPHVLPSAMAPWLRPPPHQYIPFKVIPLCQHQTNKVIYLHLYLPTEMLLYLFLNVSSLAVRTASRVTSVELLHRKFSARKELS